MNNFELALNKLDRIEQNLNDQAAEIIYKDQLIAEKDNRIAQLDKLFSGTAKIFSKQHNFVDQLKEQLKLEQQEKGISQEKAEHLQADIERLDNQKKELDKRIEELEEAEKKSKDARDKEISDLKAKIKELTEVKMAREQSEERLKKQSEDFLQVQKMNQEVYDILGEFSKEKGLFLRSKEIVETLKISYSILVDRAGHVTNLNENELEQKINLITLDTSFSTSLKNLLIEYRKEKFWWDKWINSPKNIYKTDELGFDTKEPNVYEIRWESHGANGRVRESFYPSDHDLIKKDNTDFNSNRDSFIKTRLFIKKLYKYYLNK